MMIAGSKWRLWIRMVTCWISWFRVAGTKKAAKRFFRKLLKGLRYVPRVIITDKLKSARRGEG